MTKQILNNIFPPNITVIFCQYIANIDNFPLTAQLSPSLKLKAPSWTEIGSILQWLDCPWTLCHTSICRL